MIKHINHTHKILGLVLSISMPCFANNQDLFNQATSIGNKNKFNLNLKQNSTIDSYGQLNKFESTVANNANAGTAGSQDMYNNTTRLDADPNYIFNQGKQEIANCETKSDARCSTINKYADKDTQLKLQEYKQPLSIEYSMTVTPDPTDKSCSIVKRKKPLSTTINTCITATTQSQTVCNNTLTAYEEYIPQTPNDGIVLQQDPRDVNLCSIYKVTATTGYASDYLSNPVFFVIKMNASLFTSGKLPMEFYSYNSRPNCASGTGVISINPTTTRMQIGGAINNLGISYAFYQDPGDNCGSNNSNPTCRVNVSVDIMGMRFFGATTNKWTVTFPRPKAASSVSHYVHNKGCP